MRKRSHRWWLRAVLLGASALALLGGCAGQYGQQGGDFAVVSASPERAVVSARGQAVAVEPPPGFCVAADSIETSERSAFVLIGDCVLANGAGAMPGADGALRLPPGMPGITTVSISGDPGFGPRGASPADLSALEAYLATPEGRELLGRGGNGAQVSVVETRREGDILYVLVEDRAAEALPVLAPRFWRAFIELNGRLVVATVSGFRDVPMDEAEMLRHLGEQVRQLEVANADIEAAPIRLAEAPPVVEAAPAVSAAVGPEDAASAGTEPAGAADGAWADAAEISGTEVAGTPEAAGAGVAGEDGSDGWFRLARRDPAANDASGAPVPESEATLHRESNEPTDTPRQAAPSTAVDEWPTPAERPGSGISAPVSGPGEASASPMPMPRVSHSAGAPAGSGSDVPLPPRRGN